MKSPLLESFYSLIAGKQNKAKGMDDFNQEGASSMLLPLFDVKKDDAELIQMAKLWTKAWDGSEAKKKIHTNGQESYDYWKGKQFKDSGITRPLQDNIIFEAVETLLPMATKKNPEPVVTSDGTPEGEVLADRVHKMLVSLADTLNLKGMLKKQAREWLIWYVGMLKICWDFEKDDISIDFVKSKKLVLDPNAICENAYYNGEYLGEIKNHLNAKQVIEKFKSMPGFDSQKEEELKGYVAGYLGTKLAFTEWWTKDYVFWTCRGTLLGKSNNPYWNYGTKQMVTDDYGIDKEKEVQGNNHLQIREIPYIPLVVFNTGELPVDETSLIEQGLPLQDLINKRTRQIDKNADNANAGVVVSGDYFTKEEAAEASEALRKGATLFVPNGDVNAAYKRDVAPSLPPYIYNSLQDYRNRFMDLFGVRGSTSQGIQSENTVRGKILAKGSDSDRVGGGVSDFLEQVADRVFNYMVQMMYVFYDEEHMASLVGQAKANEVVTLRSSDFKNKLFITVKEGSLIPKDQLTTRNEAIDLWSAQAIDPLTLFERLDFPNPKEAMERLVMWQTNPMGLVQGPVTPTEAPQNPQMPQPEGGDPMSQVPIQ